MEDKPEPTMTIALDSTSIVDTRTGNVSSPKEAIDELRELENEITRCDESVDQIAGALKGAKEAREKAIGALRAACREAKALPLFDGAAKR